MGMQSKVPVIGAKLKPCPFCGRPATLVDALDTLEPGEPDDGSRGVRCNDARCPVKPMVWKVTAIEAIKAWNARR